MGTKVTGRCNLHRWNANHRKSMSPRKRSSEPELPDPRDFPSAEDDPLSKQQREELARRRKDETKEKFSGDGGTDAPRSRSEAGNTMERVRRSIPRRLETIQLASDVMFAPTLSEAWNDFIRAQEVRGLSDSSLEQMNRIARALVEVVGDHKVFEVSMTDVEDYIVWMRRKGNSPSTINTNLQWVKAFFNWCAGKGKGEHPLAGGKILLSFDVNEIRGVKAPKTQKRIANPDCVSRLIGSLDASTFDGLRFKTTILLMLDTGVRAGEICAMDTTDVSNDHQSIRVWGKGARERTVYLSREMSEQLKAWISYRAAAMDYAGMMDNVVLFPSLTGNRQISVQVGDLFRSRCRLAGITPAVTAHGLRHLWATNHVARGTNAFLLRQLGGWAGMQIVTTYISEVDRDEAALANDNASLVKGIVGRRVPRRQRDAE